ncbi:MAG: hypothetical protein Q9P90_14230 [candidate division KSB1 bacterium]|nr:hypothetical protein [candidate division KSB1 bacterium]
MKKRVHAFPGFEIMQSAGIKSDISQSGPDARRVFSRISQENPQGLIFKPTRMERMTRMFVELHFMRQCESPKSDTQ